jgi:hypothetical protein
VAEHLETGVVEQVLDVVAPAGEEIVEADDLVPLGEQTIAQVGADEAGAAGDQYPHGFSTSGEGQ